MLYILINYLNQFVEFIIMRILSIDFPTSLFHSTTQGWNQTPPHETKNPTVSIAHTLKNFLLWLIFINLINHYISNFKLYFGEIDIVLILSNSSLEPISSTNVSPLSTMKEINKFIINQDLENILRGIYVRNEDIYLNNINQTTILCQPIIMCNDNSIQMLFLEKFYNDNQGNFKYQNLIKVESILLQKFVNKNTNFDLSSSLSSSSSSMKRNDLIEQFLRIVLTRLYPRYFGHILPSIGGGGGGFGGVDTIVNANHIGISNKDNVGEMTSSLNVDRIVKKVRNSMIPITVGKIGLLINSIILFLLYVLLHCCPKILIWHYVNLGSLYLINLLNVAFILMILISKSQLKTYSTKDFGYILIVFEFLSILSIMVLFFHDHKSIMKRQLFVAYSCSSSVYSDHMDKPGTANSSGHKDINGNNLSNTLPPPQQQQQSASRPPPPPLFPSSISPPLSYYPDHQSGYSIKPKEKQYQQGQTQAQDQLHRVSSIRAQSLQEQYSTPVPVSTPIINDQITTNLKNDIDRRCITAPVKVVKKLDSTKPQYQHHPGYLPNLKL